MLPNNQNPVVKISEIIFLMLPDPKIPDSEDGSCF